MKVLWLDDDLAASIEEVGITRQHLDHVHVDRVATCRDAFSALGKTRYDGLVIDSLVPQGGWGERMMRLPGVELARVVACSADRPQRLAFLSMTPGREEDVISRRWGVPVYQKEKTTFNEILRMWSKVAVRTLRANMAETPAPFEFSVEGGKADEG